MTITEFYGEGTGWPMLADLLGKGCSSVESRMPYTKGVMIAEKEGFRMMTAQYL